jgi:selenocysteine lyase/cysteine desulfurase
MPAFVSPYQERSCVGCFISGGASSRSNLASSSNSHPDLALKHIEEVEKRGGIVGVGIVHYNRLGEVDQLLAVVDNLAEPDEI